jgi:hypothetical protein
MCTIQQCRYGGAHRKWKQTITKMNEKEKNLMKRYVSAEGGKVSPRRREEHAKQP